MKLSEKLAMIFMSLVILGCGVFFVVKNYVPKQEINNGTVWEYAGFDNLEELQRKEKDVSNKFMIMAIYLRLERDYLIYQGTSEKNAQAKAAYITCNDGEIFLNYYVGVGEGHEDRPDDLFAVCKLKTEKIGTYKGKKIKLDSTTSYTKAYASDNVLYMTLKNTGYNFILKFTLKDTASVSSDE